MIGITSRRGTLALIAVVALVAGACAGSAGLDVAGDAGAPAATGAPAPFAGSDTDGEAYRQGGAGEQPATDPDEPGALKDETKVVYTGTLDLLVTDVARAVADARALVTEAGGYVGASREWREGDTPVASITYRIPAPRWDATLTALRAIGTEVVREETSAIEVTGQIVDLEARIRNLRASETALQAILADATRISDVLEVQRELTEVRGQIEQLDAQRVRLEDQAAYGTLTTTFGVETVAVIEAAKGWDPATEVDQASASLVSVLQALATAGIWFAIVWLPILLVLGAIVVAALFVLRRTGVLRRPQAGTYGT